MAEVEKPKQSRHINQIHSIMKKNLIFLSVLLLFAAKESIAQTWQWATLLEGVGTSSDNIVVKGVDVDATGNTYVTGYYKGRLNSSLLSISDQQDGFLAKFDAAGVLQWANKFGGIGNDAGNAISVETYSTGAIYITGYVQYNDPANITFNGTTNYSVMPSATACVSTATPNTIYLRAGLSSKQAFVAKYWTNGAVQWVKPIYSISCLDGEGLGLSASFHHSNGVNYARDIYVTGYFEGNSASFMSNTPCSFINVNGNSLNKTGYVAKLSGSSGNAIWAKSFAVPSNVNAMSIGKNVLLDYASANGYTSGGGLFITGDYQSSANIGGTVITNAGNNTLGFVASLNPTNGTAAWVTQITGSGSNANVEARDVNCRQSNFDELFALGDFSGNTVSSGGSSATNGGGRDIYLIKLTKTTGAVSIVKSEGGVDDQYAYGLDVSASGPVGNPEVFISGGYNNSITFSGGSSFGFYGATTNDHYMSKYDLSLNNMCATHWDASMNLYTNTLDACDVAASKESLNGAAYFGGMFLNNETPVFSPLAALTTTNLVSGYVAKWLCCDCPPPTISVVRSGTSATVSFTYPPCDNSSGAFILSYQLTPNPPMTQPILWGTPSFVVSGLNPLPAMYNWVALNNCALPSNPIVAKATPIKELGGDVSDLKFEVYPNPSEHTINFESNQNGSVEIYNILGELIKRKQFSGASKINMDVTEVPSGNYVCKFISENNAIITKKIQVVH